MKFSFDLGCRINIDEYGRIIEKRGLEENGRAQQILDSEVLRLCDPYVPFDTGMLRDSGMLATEIGSGIVRYNTPYARHQYYHNSGLLQHGLRGKLWFERMKADHLDGLRRRVGEACGCSIT